MRRTARRLFTFASALSLLLLVTAGVLWVRSYLLTDQVDWRGDRGWRAVSTAQGHVVVGLFVADWSDQTAGFHGPRYQRLRPTGPFNYLLFLSHDRGDSYVSWEWAGAAWHSRRSARGGVLNVHAVVPFWSIAAVTLPLPLAWGTAWWRSRARARPANRLGLCPACGYDLRASPQRCPECGASALARGTIGPPAVGRT